ncbi:hypothetical protein GCM10009678_31720 [Actinomadura kijaniata]|uniref:Uncharacterized protein n=1 Tax=Actinomadura namibiensis TaxID=182080 RepID=A0A7W3QIX4_ACTNM|nr:hypothetical protein [Actinomadura namibiensis]MBA8948687.1 hypothetical protein [Actinomadura namibiensis]
MSPAKDGAKKRNVVPPLMIVLVLTLIFGPPLWAMFDREKVDYNTAPVFGPRESGQLVARLDAAAKAQGVCYGWIIDSDRFGDVQKVTPSYPGTFSPQPNATPSPTPTRSARPTPTTRPTDRPTTRPTTRPTRTAGPTPTPSGPSSELAGVLRGSGVEYGSNLGVDIAPWQRPEACPKWAVLKAEYTWSSIEGEWTSADLDVETNFGGDIPSPEIRMDIYGSDLTGENGIARLADAIGGLPLLMASEGKAGPVPDAPAQAAPAGDTLPGRGAGFYIFLTIAIGLIVGGVAWIAVAAVRTRRGN